MTARVGLNASLLRIYDALLAAHMPPGLLVGEDRSLVHVFPGAARYLRVPEGRPSLDVLEQLVPELRAAVAGALQRLQHASQQVTLHGLRVHGTTVDVRAWRVFDSAQASPIVVALEERGNELAVEDDGETLQADALTASRIQSLERELQQSQESLHALEAANQELQSSNEELVASNEELQSTNEELQSVNEELDTVNAECQLEISELTEISRDMDHLLSSMEVGILFLDSDLRIRKFTPLAVELFNLEPQDVGRSVADFRFTVDYADLLEDARAVLNGVRRIDREVKDHRGNWYLLRLRPYLVESQVRGAVLTLIDVAALKAAEERIRNAVARRDEFIAMLSHELRNPLAAIVSAIDLARFKGHGEVALDTKIVSIIDRQAAQMARILEDLLDLSRITRNKLELRRERLDLRSAVEASVDALGSKAERAGIDLELDLGDEPIWVAGDTGRLQQVITNLVDNALKYNSPGGHVWVTVGSDATRATVAVRDDGIGIGEEHLERLFEPFVQSTRGMSRADGGMGVGLSLVRSITELHGGTATVHSDGPGSGSIFEIELPVLEAGELELQPREARAPREPTDSEFILLVEDEQDSRELLSALLEQQGYRVRSAADGAAALQIIEASRPSLALIDIGIPKPDGYQVARVAREAYPEIPLVALTGYGRDGDRDESSSSGFDEHLLKPIDMQTLQAVVQRLLGVAVRPAVARD
ncbi:MAG TPA: ATP-binding protein [Kofleriaceae bacterium]|nr:ATP-binding protein [Kofleriaceae bacterium]